MIYFDNAATTLIKPLAVERAVLNAMRSCASPGRGGHEPAMKAAEIVYNCRECAAEYFNVPQVENVIFTFNATHALNIAIHSLVRPGSRVVVSGFEHNSAVRPVYALTENVTVAGSRLFDTDNTLNEFEDKLKNADYAVCTYVSNAFGYVLPIKEISELCRMKNVPLIIDASQAAGILPIDFEALNAEFIAMPGHKGLYGPQGTGLLLCKERGEPLLFGGTGADSILKTMPDYMPDMQEAGTHNVCGISGLYEGLKFVRSKRELISHEHQLLKEMLKELVNIPDITAFSGETQSGVLSVVSNRYSSEELASLLADRGVCVRAGLHCSPLAHQCAGTLEHGTVRFSFSAFNTISEVRECCRIIKELIY